MEEYKIRFKNEYKELKERYNKLHKMIVKAEAGTLDFEFDCPLSLLENQARVMGEYLHILEIRAEIEKIDLEDKTSVNVNKGLDKDQHVTIVEII
jgi:hypothetical protein